MQQDAGVKTPKKWKMMFVAFCFVYPFINIIFFVLGDILAPMHQLLRTLILALIFVPTFAIVIPILQGKLRNWICK